ncbi:MAG TPA: replication factor C large subunit [Candidatus Pacearchaeota archaeon]|jgi:replication factor C large subunit|nr:replication factor C large subunit [Candidatus Pacearchaeota archaeon]|tara:strand:+ start:448 stop:1665 length:1218 start_codon:yes stop_codon:yes gene_type:complete
MIPLIEKYRVDNLNDIKGQSIAVEEVRNFLRMFPAKKALILNGPVGTGKTSMALALAKENDLELFELNASDLRNRSSLEAVLKPSLEQQSLFGKSKLILMDEADGITGSDRGGLPELIALISKTKVPIIITSNDIWKKKFSLLRKSCKIISLKELSDIDVKQIITEVLKKEDKKIKSETIDLIVKGARGDVRAALNDLESVILLGEENIDDISLREKKQDIFNDLKKLFQNQVDEQTLRIFDNSDLSIDEILLWVEENIPLEYQGKALTKAYECLSRADIFKGRIYRKQYWRFLVYQSFFLSGGVASATRLKNNRFISYKKPTRILKIWMANMRNAKIKSIIEKYAKLCHMSKKKAMKDKNLMPLILSSLNEETKNKMDLEDKEIDYLKEKEIDLVVSSGLNRYK